MKLILFRHGLAMERDEAIKIRMEDSLRPLVDKGKEKAKVMSKALHKWEREVDFIVSSPYVRAMETAEILGGVYGGLEIQESAELVPSCPPAAFAQWLKSNAKTATTVVAVGHEPHLSCFASWSLTGSKTSFIDLKKSGMLCLEIESFEDLGPQSALLRWSVQPKNII